MDVLSFLTFAGRLALAGTFALAAVAKWRDRESARSAAVDLGLPPAVAPAVSALLPPVELAVAAGLLVTPIAGWAAVTACILLGAFTALVVRSLRRGRRPACGCFGAASSAPIGARTVVRNLVLAAVAATVVARWSHAGTAAIGRYRDLTGAQMTGLVAAVAIGGVLAGVAWMLVNLVHQQGRLLERIEALEARGGTHRSSTAGVGAGPWHRRRPGPAIGSPAPRFELPDVAGGRASIDDLLADGRPQVLLFLEPGCEACVAMSDELARAASASPSADPARAVIGIVRAALGADLDGFSPASFDRLLADPTGAVAAQLGVQGTPSAVVILPDGRIGSALAEGRAAVRRLVRRHDPVSPPAVHLDPHQLQEVH